MGSVGKIIKVYLPQFIIDIINKDIDSFNIKSKSGKANLSGFCNLLFMNLKDKAFNEKLKLKYYLKKDILENILGKKLKELDISEEDINELNKSIVNQFFALYDEIMKGKRGSYSDFISFRLNIKNSIYLEEIIENNLAENITISDYFRMLFEEYAARPQYSREKILFSKTYNTIKESIDKTHKIKIKLKGHSVYYTSSPTLLNNSKEEQYNYLILLDEERNVRSVRLSHIDDIILLKNTKIVLTDQEKGKIEKLKENFDPFTFNFSQIRLRLTEEGENLYQRIVHNRPDYIKKEKDNEYIFNCSKDKIFVYFFSFGNNVEILEPTDLRNRFKTAYEKSLEIYES
ncbi:MAG: WYL domain-containing protein [Eubacteriales bacterium]